MGLLATTRKENNVNEAQKRPNTHLSLKFREIVGTEAVIYNFEFEVFSKYIQSDVPGVHKFSNDKFSAKI